MKVTIIASLSTAIIPGVKEYNIIWDKMWNLNIFPNNVISKEINYYLTKQNLYGLPLDSAEITQNPDWIMWTAAMSQTIEIFEKFVDPLYKIHQ